jgi:excisionase family DNA binding protein
MSDPQFVLASAARDDADRLLSDAIRQWVGVPELAKAIGCDRRTILRMIAIGSVKAERHGRCWRITWVEAKRAFPHTLAAR